MTKIKMDQLNVLSIDSHELMTEINRLRKIIEADNSEMTILACEIKGYRVTVFKLIDRLRVSGGNIDNLFQEDDTDTVYYSKSANIAVNRYNFKQKIKEQEKEIKVLQNTIEINNKSIFHRIKFLLFGN